LLARNGDLVTLLKRPLQGIKRQMIIILGEQHKNGQPQAQLASRQEARGQRCDRDSAASAGAYPFNPHCTAQNQARWNQVQLFGNFFADTPA
jgi:hypothetical protein